MFFFIVVWFSILKHVAWFMFSYFEAAHICSDRDVMEMRYKIDVR